MQLFNGILLVLSSSSSWPLAAGTGCLKQITKDIEATEIIVVDYIAMPMTVLEPALPP